MLLNPGHNRYSNAGSVFDLLSDLEHCHRTDIMDRLKDLYLEQRSKGELSMYPKCFNVTTLHRLCREADGFISMLFFPNLNINEQDVYGWTPLHHAAVQENRRCATLLVRQGADLLRTNLEGYTALHYSVQFLGPIITHHILENAKMYRQTLQTDSLDELGDASDAGKVGALLTVQGNDGMTVLHKAAEQGNVKVIFDLCRLAARQTSVQDLLESENVMGYMPVHIAALCGQVQALEQLVSRGADIHRQLKHGWTILHLAMAHDGSKDRKGMVKKLIELSVDVERRNENGETALLFACRMQRWNAVHELIRANADAIIVDSRGDTPLHWVARNGYRDTLSLLLSLGADLNAVNKKGHTPLFAAVMKGNVYAVRMLLARAADAGITGVSGRSPLHIAVEKGRVGVIQTLLEHDSNIEIGDEDGETPLDMALLIGDLSVILAILNIKAKVDALPRLSDLRRHPKVVSLIRQSHSRTEKEEVGLHAD